jgi:hypothetical protein
VRDLLETLTGLRDRFSYRIPTPKLNKLIREALLVRPPPTHRGRSLNILYAHQRPEWPASFTLKVNDPKLVHFSFRRYLENTLRQFGEFEGFPMVIRFLRRGESAKIDRKKRLAEEAIEEVAATQEAQPGKTVDERLISRVPQRRKKKRKVIVRTPSKPLETGPKKTRKPVKTKRPGAPVPRGKTRNKPGKKGGKR